MMKKITVKQLMLLSLFVAIAWSASAQMKVGDNPNTINKGSVLELEAKDKGVLYPRVALTASNVWAPLQGTAVAGMTVYNTTTVTATTSATTSLSPGFYFWEGAKWNKIATEGEVADGVEWVFENDTINLKRSGTAPFRNVVYYTNKGEFRNIDLPEEDVLSFNGVTNTESVDKVPHGATKNSTLVKTSTIELPANVTPDEWGNISASSFRKLTYFDQVPTQATIYTGQYSGIYVPTTVANINDLTSITGASSDVSYRSSAQLQSITGSYAGALAGYNSNIDRLYGARNQIRVYTSSNMKSVRAAENYSYLRGSGNIGAAIGGSDLVVFQNSSTSTVDKLIGREIMLRNWQGSTPTLKTVIGLSISGYTNSSGTIPNMQDYTGLLIGDIKDATKSNHAIYTNAGDIRFGDLKGTGDRMVVANANGVLKTKDAASLIGTAASKWTNDATNKVVKLTNLSDGTTARTEDKNIFIADDGKIGIGTATPYCRFAVESSGKDYSGSAIQFRTYRDIGAVGLDFLRARGTKEAPLSVTDGDGLGAINSYGYNGSEFERSAALMFSVEGTPNADFIPAKFDIGFQRQATGGNLKNGFVSVFHISNSGNTGIGTITPTEKLEVAGNVKAISFIAANMRTYPDYVFETYYNGTSELNNEYGFMSLEEVEAFTKANNHLPGYESARAVAEKGSVDLGATQLKNVEKIEELYLHVIEQNKENKALRNEVEELKSLVQQLLAK